MSITATALIPGRDVPGPGPAGRSWRHAARLVLGALVCQLSQ